jgi:PilZ domain-containing protein
MEELRRTRRARVLKSGRIIVSDTLHKIECTVRDLSDGGARLIVPSSTFGVPPEFKLAIGEAAPRPCRVVRRTMTEVGVQFV